jgi:hypothetical protein
MVSTDPISSVTQKPNRFNSMVANAIRLLTILCLISEGELLPERLTYCNISMLGVNKGTVHSLMMINCTKWVMAGFNKNPTFNPKSVEN